MLTLRRRDFLTLVGLTACSTIAPAPSPTVDAAPSNPEDPDAPPAEVPTDSCRPATVLMHDTNAQALYLDGTFGPYANVIRVAYIVAGTTITLDFWHGHNGVLHRFTVEPQHFAALLRGERVTLATTMVDDHAHTLFIDPRDEDYRVPGAPDVAVPLSHC